MTRAYKFRHGLVHMLFSLLCVYPFISVNLSTLLLDRSPTHLCFSFFSFHSPFHPSLPLLSILALQVTLSTPKLQLLLSLPPHSSHHKVSTHPCPSIHPCLSSHCRVSPHPCLSIHLCLYSHSYLSTYLCISTHL